MAFCRKTNAALGYPNHPSATPGCVWPVKNDLLRPALAVGDGLQGSNQFLRHTLEGVHEVHE